MNSEQDELRHVLRDNGVVWAIKPALCEDADTIQVRSEMVAAITGNLHVNIGEITPVLPLALF